MQPKTAKPPALAVGSFTYDWRLDAYRAWLWAIAVLRERESGEPTESNYRRWCEQQGVPHEHV